MKESRSQVRVRNRQGLIDRNGAWERKMNGRAPTNQIYIGHVVRYGTVTALRCGRVGECPPKALMRSCALHCLAFSGVGASIKRNPSSRSCPSVLSPFLHLHAVRKSQHSPCLAVDLRLSSSLITLITGHFRNRLGTSSTLDCLC